MQNEAIKANVISIHAPRMGSDMLWLVIILLIADFNPRSPHGERLLVIFLIFRLIRFQSTLPAWGATIRIQELPASMEFQSTLPAWGATQCNR